MAAGSVSPKMGKIVDIPDQTVTIGTATDGGTGTTASVAFTAGSVATGGPVSYFTATSTPGSFTANGTTSPITVSGLTDGTSYTFKVKAGNATGYSTAGESAASNSVTIEALGDYQSIATATGTGSSDTITFSSIPQTYSHLQIRIFAKGAGTGNGVGTGSIMVFNGDTTATNYWRHGINAYGSAVSANNGNDNAFWDIVGSNTGLTSIYAPNVIDILDYTNTNKKTTVRSIVGEDTNGNGVHLGIRSGLWNNTAAITSITLQSYGGNFTTASHIALYGIKG